MISLALIGCGNHARRHHAAALLRYATEQPDRLRLAAACDLDRSRADVCRREFGFGKSYDDVEAMLAREKPDGVVCVMPVARIAEMGIALLEKGVPCVIEKPLGASLAEAAHLADAAERSGTPHMVSMNRRFMPQLNQALSWAREAGAGPLRQEGRPAGEIRFVRGAMIRTDRREPNFIWATAVHAVDALRHVAGDVESFRAERIGGRDSPAWYAIDFRFAEGRLGRLDILPTAGMTEETYELFGEGFRASASADGRLRCWRGGELAVDETGEGTPEVVTSGAYGETASFAEALRSGTAPAPSIRDVLPSLEICSRVAEEAGSPGSP